MVRLSRDSESIHKEVKRRFRTYFIEASNICFVLLDHGELINHINASMPSSPQEIAFLKHHASSAIIVKHLEMKLPFLQDKAVYYQ